MWQKESALSDAAEQKEKACCMWPCICEDDMVERLFYDNGDILPGETKRGGRP